MTKSLAILACVVALFAATLPAHANEVDVQDFNVSATTEDSEGFLAPPGRGRRVATCYAQNRAGQTFGARARNINLRRLQNLAVRSCRQNSPFFLARTCQPIGCRVSR